MDEVYHDNGEAQLVGFFNTREGRFFFVPPLSKQNPYRQKEIADRLMKQLEEEGVSLYGYIDTEFKTSYTQGLRRKNVRHRTIRQKGNLTVVLSELGRNKLPEEPVKLQELLIEWVANMPPKSRIGGNNDFGGKHAGFRRETKEPGKNIRLDRIIERDDVVETLKADEKKWYAAGASVILEMEHDKAIEYVEETFVSSKRSE